jgi:hypothetical protein
VVTVVAIASSLLSLVHPWLSIPRLHTPDVRARTHSSLTMKTAPPQEPGHPAATRKQVIPSSRFFQSGIIHSNRSHLVESQRRTDQPAPGSCRVECMVDDETDGKAGVITGSNESLKSAPVPVCSTRSREGISRTSFTPDCLPSRSSTSTTTTSISRFLIACRSSWCPQVNRGRV